MSFPHCGVSFLRSTIEAGNYYCCPELAACSNSAVSSRDQEGAAVLAYEQFVLTLYPNSGFHANLTCKGDIALG
jgi:hypothetical protein